jgi:glutamate mutase epsilon subunit
LAQPIQGIHLDTNLVADFVQTILQHLPFKIPPLIVGKLTGTLIGPNISVPTVVAMDVPAEEPGVKNLLVTIGWPAITAVGKDFVHNLFFNKASD